MAGASKAQRHIWIVNSLRAILSFLEWRLIVVRFRTLCPPSSEGSSSQCLRVYNSFQLTVFFIVYGISALSGLLFAIALRSYYFLQTLTSEIWLLWAQKRYKVRRRGIQKKKKWLLLKLVAPWGHKRRYYTWIVENETWNITDISLFIGGKGWISKNNYFFNNIDSIINISIFTIKLL